MSVNFRGMFTIKTRGRYTQFFSADMPHGIHGFWSRKGPRNHPLDLEKFLERVWNCWKVALEIRGFWPENEEKIRLSLGFFLQIGLKESMLSGAEKQREIILLTFKNSRKVALDIKLVLYCQVSLDWIRSSRYSDCPFFVLIFGYCWTY